MKSRLLIALLLGLSVGSGALARVADISGTWTFTVRLPDGDSQSTFVFKQEGEKLAGTYSGPLGPANVTGTVKGADAVFSFTGKNNQGDAITVDYAAKIVSPARMTGTIDFHKGPPLEWTATKK